MIHGSLIFGKNVKIFRIWLFSTFFTSPFFIHSQYLASEEEKKTILMGHKISSFYAPSSQVFSHIFYFDRIKFL